MAAATATSTHVDNSSIFRAALPYGVGTLTVGGVGVYAIAASAGSTAAVITGIAMAAIGAYAFLGVVLTACVSNNAKDFQDNVWKGMTTAAGTGLAELINHAARVAIEQLVKSGMQALFSRR